MHKVLCFEGVHVSQAHLTKYIITAKRKFGTEVSNKIKTHVLVCPKNISLSLRVFKMIGHT
jgi:hypothetical protein